MWMLSSCNSSSRLMESVLASCAAPTVAPRASIQLVNSGPPVGTQRWMIVYRIDRLPSMLVGEKDMDMV